MSFVVTRLTRRQNDNAGGHTDKDMMRDNAIF
jgi:hypothetical protein